MLKKRIRTTKLYHEVINPHDGRLEESISDPQNQISTSMQPLYFSTSFTTEAARAQKGSRLSEFTFQ